MEPIQKPPGVVAGQAPVSRFGGMRAPLRREIVVVLLIKLVLIVAIKMIFFSHPMGQREAVARLDAMISSEASAPAPPLPLPHTDKTE